MMSQFFQKTESGLTNGTPRQSNFPFPPDWIYFHQNAGLIVAQFDSGPTIPVSRGMVFPLDGTVNQVTLNAQLGGPGAGSSVLYWIGTGPMPAMYTAARDRLNGRSQISDVNVAAAGTTQIWSAQMAAVRVWASIPAGGAGPLRVGLSAANASRGLSLNAGAAPFEFDGTSDMYAFNAAGVVVPVSFMYETAN